MGTKTIGVRDDVYDRLSARKRDDESFTDLVDRLLDETSADWREGFGTLPEDEGAALAAVVARSRRDLGEGLSGRQADALDRLAAATDDDG